MSTTTRAARLKAAPPPMSQVSAAILGIRPTLANFADLVRKATYIRLADESRLLQPVCGPPMPIAPALFGEVKGVTASPEMQQWCRETKNSYSEGRGLDGQVTACVLLNSIQAEANALEQGLLMARDENPDLIPDLVIDFTGDARTRHLGRLGSLSLPHRGYDALVRDSLLNGVPYCNTREGRALLDARPDNATALLALPHMAVLGAWHSQGAGGGGGAKFGRILRCEIIGYGARPATIAASRIDPAGIAKSVLIYQPQTTTADQGDHSVPTRPNVGWETDPAFAELDGKGQPILYAAKRGAGKKEQGKASLLNHGNVLPSTRSGRATIAGAIQVMDLSLVALRQLKFRPAPGVPGAGQRNRLAWTALAAYALVGMTQRLAAGCHLRSGCELIAVKNPRLEVIGTSLEDVRAFDIDPDGALSLLGEAVAALRAEGMAWGSSSTAELVPSPQVVEAIAASQAIADELESDE